MTTLLPPAAGLAHDHQIRALLKAHVAARLTEKDLVVDEFGLAYGDVRADVAIVNGALEGFEIKAGRDTLLRLPAQISAYNKVFEFAWVVTTAAHQDKVLSHIPAWWGLIVATAGTDGAVLVERRAAQRNLHRDPKHLARLLWREELLAKLESIGMDKGVKSKPKVVLYDVLANALPVDLLGAYVLQCLKARSTWRVATEPRTGGGSSHHKSTS